MAAPSSTPRATQDQTASDDMGALIGRMLESGRAPPVDGRSETYEVDESLGRSFLMSELTTAASLAGSRVNLANSVPPARSCAGRSSAVVAPRVLYARRLPIRKYEISRLSPHRGPACPCQCDTRASGRLTPRPGAGAFPGRAGPVASPIERGPRTAERG